MRRVTLQLFVGALAVALLLSGGLAKAQAETQLVVAKGATIRNLYPNSADVDATLSALGNMYETLYRRSPDGSLLPALATSWERVDLYTWKFKLREGVTFWNGNPFTAEDVKFSFERLASDYPELGEVSEYTYTGNKIKSIETPDKYTVIITTKDPYPIMLSISPYIFMMDKEWTKARSLDYLTTHTMGTGPYKFVEWVKGDHLTLEANENYWAGKPAIDKVVIRPIVEASTRVASLLAGEVAMVWDLPVKLLDRVKADPDIQVVERAGRRTIFFGINASTGPDPLNDAKVRKAIYMAIDEKAILEKVMFGHAALATQLVGPADFGYDPSIERFPYDPERAKKLLAEAGYPDGFSLDIDCPYDRYVQDEQICTAAASMLKKIGVTATVHTRTKSVHFSRLVDDKTKGLCMVGWITAAYDTGRMLLVHVQSRDPEKGYGSWNPGIRDPELDKCIEKTPGITDQEKRQEALQECMRETMDKAYFVPLHVQNNIFGVKKGIKFSPRTDNWFVAMEVSFEK